jgi:demethylmenaquinone methyltransferase / 2-methoxy-6-polyprenyl-1,4-benzoquinol methylase
MSTSNPESTWFGYRPVRPEEKTDLVGTVFDSVAERYDLMNDLMSGGLHRLWKNRLVEIINPQPGHVVLDVAGGTGDIALRCHKRTRGRAHVTVCDINPTMVKQGQAKALDHGILSAITWIVGDAEALPRSSCSVDHYSIAFGLRNVTHIDKALREAVRVLKPGGRFYCLEFSPGVVRSVKPLYDRYCATVVPLLGQWVVGNREAYQYLAESIQKFPVPSVLAKRMEQAGLSQVKWQKLTGGIAVIHTGWRL